MRDTRASLNCFSILNSDTLKKAPDQGLDAREGLEELKDDETALVTCAADVALIGLDTVHGFMNLVQGSVILREAIPKLAMSTVKRRHYRRYCRYL